MEVRHARMISQRLRLLGKKRINLEGDEEVSFTGNSWVELSSNDHRKNEKPLEKPIIYQAPIVESDNGREKSQVHGSVEISIPVK